MVLLNVRGCGGLVLGEVPVLASASGLPASPASLHVPSSGVGSGFAVGGRARTSGGETGSDKALSMLPGRRMVFPFTVNPVQTSSAVPCWSSVWRR